MGRRVGSIPSRHRAGRVTGTLLAAVVWAFARMLFAQTPESKATPAGRAAQQQLIDREKQFWYALDNRNLPALAELLADNAVLMHKGNGMSKREYLKAVAGENYKPFSVDDVQVTRLTVDAADVTSEFIGTDRDRRLPPTCFHVVSKWALQGGKWMLIQRSATRVSAEKLIGAM
jgi:hypothetical protein